MSPQARLGIDRRTYLKMASGAASIPSLASAVSAYSGETVEETQHHGEKLDRLDRYLNEKGLEAVWFADSDSYAWLTGHSNVISRSSPTGVAAVGYDGSDLTIVVDNDEQALVRQELFQSTDVTIETFPWYANSLGGAVAQHSPTPAAADFDVPGFEHVNASPLRQPLTEGDIARYRSVGSETAAAVEGVCRNIQSCDTEEEVATALECALDEYRLNHPVILVAGEDRAQKFRHPVPTDAKLGGYVVVSVVGHRLGEYASCTRTVAFDPPEWLQKRHEIAMRIDATALIATQKVAQAGGTAGDIFEIIQAGYEDAGYPKEWQEHHQGGAAGYASREWVAKPDLQTNATIPMAYAWNPTVEGAKREGTVLVTEDEFEPFTLTGDWPTQNAKSYVDDEEVTRPSVLDRSA